MRFGFNLFVGGFLLFAVIALFALGIYEDAWIGVVGFGAAALIASLVAGRDAKKAQDHRHMPALLVLAQADTARSGIGDYWFEEHPVALTVFVVLLVALIGGFVYGRRRARRERETTVRMGGSASAGDRLRPPEKR